MGNGIMFLIISLLLSDSIDYQKFGIKNPLGVENNFEYDIKINIYSWFLYFYYYSNYYYYYLKG